MDKTLSRPGRALSKKIVIWLVLASLILAGISGLIFRSITQLLRSGDWVAHSYQVLDALENTQAFFLDAEAAERGYIATCRPAMITPFRRDLPQIYAKLATLRALTADNDDHRERLIQLSHTMTGELERMSTAITTTLGGDQTGGETMLADSQNTQATRQVAAGLAQMEREERDILEGRLHDVQLFARATLITCAVGVAAIFAILGFVFWLIRRETRRRERTETSLQQSNEKLEGSLKELHRYNASARAVSLLGELLQTCRTTEEAVSIAVRHLRDMMPETAVAVALFNNSRDGVEVAQSAGDGALFAPLFRSDDCWSLRRGRAHQAGPESFEPYCTHLEAQRQYMLCVPMMAQGETLGVLSLVRAGGFADMERQSIQTITEQLSLALANIRLQDSLRNQSLRDPLTGLYNRRYMDEALAREVNHAARQKSALTVAMIDVDHFKRYNDTHGHEGGDALLAAFGRLLARQARAEDIVCRYGGEEFAIIMPGAEIADAGARLDAVRSEAARLHVELRGQALSRITMSAGLAAYPRDGSTGAALLAAADAALYAAKKGGRDRVVSAPAGVEAARA
jgi:diguanylate cyclase (GGDEF)-like protein